MVTEIEKKALALLNEVARERGSTHDSELLDRGFVEGEALCRAIEQHEAFRQDINDELLAWFGSCLPEDFTPFIIPKTDPLVEVLDECGFGVSSNAADNIREAIEKRGGKIVWEDK